MQGWEAEDADLGEALRWPIKLCFQHPQFFNPLNWSSFLDLFNLLTFGFRQQKRGKR